MSTHNESKASHDVMSTAPTLSQDIDENTQAQRTHQTWSGTPLFGPHVSAATSCSYALTECDWGLLGESYVSHCSAGRSEQNLLARNTNEGFLDDALLKGRDWGEFGESMWEQP